jgi:uncharacterized membrane protein YvbJ
MAYCPQCGAYITEKDKFCPNCGNNLNKEQEVIIEKTTIVRKRSWLSIIITIIISLLAIGALLIVWYMTKNLFL